MECRIEDAPYEEGANSVVQVEHSLEVLTRGIPEYALIDEVPLQYQRHIVGVPIRLHQFLDRVIRAMSCYHEHHVGRYLSLVFILYNYVGLRSHVSQDTIFDIVM